MKERQRKFNIKLPSSRAASASELARRQRLLDEAARLREEIGPIKVTVAELLSEVRESTGGR